MLKKGFILALILCTTNIASAFNLYSQTGKEKSLNLGLRYLLVQNKYYPALEASGYLSYAGVGLHIGKIYSKKPFTEFGNTKNLGYFWGRGLGDEVLGENYLIPIFSTL